MHNESVCDTILQWGSLYTLKVRKRDCHVRERLSTTVCDEVCVVSSGVCCVGVISPGLLPIKRFKLFSLLVLISHR